MSAPEREFPHEWLCSQLERDRERFDDLLARYKKARENVNAGIDTENSKLLCRELLTEILDLYE